MENALRYAPLFALAILALLGGIAIGAGQGGDWMSPFMGLALLMFGFLKVVNWPGFVTGFKRYDVLAQTIPGYAWGYPLFELALAFAYLANLQPDAAMLTLAVVNLGSVGLALSKGLNVECACMGTALNVPLSTVTIAEYGTMAAMAVYMLLA